MVDARVVAIDPGPTESAFVVMADGDKILEHGKIANEDLLRRIDGWATGLSTAHLVIERIASYGMAVGESVFSTCLWSGRYLERWNVHRYDESVHLMYRREVKLHLCGNVRAKDTNTRQAVIDRFGPDKAKAIGTKGAPGPLFGLTKDRWQALCLAVTWADTNPQEKTR